MESPQKESGGYRPSILNLGNGWLYRVQVALPDSMCPRDESMLERVVFFQAPTPDKNEAWAYLTKLLDAAWCVNTAEWHPDMIYNLYRADERIKDSYGDASTGDLRLLECGMGWSPGMNSDRIYYWRAKEVDLFVGPSTAIRLHELLNQIECLYQEAEMVAEKVS